ncbi:MAG: SMC-Scp complex subunit ScpB [Terracidiphilus sp.]|nr:SMC-Scp complex subunit ScpB [Terracidiphilus sp.]
MSLKAKLEAVIYAAEEPVTLAQLATLFADEALEWKAEQDAATAEAQAEAENEQAAEEAPLLQNVLDGKSTGESDGESLPAAEAEAAGPETAEAESETAPAESGAESEAAEAGPAAEPDQTELQPESPEASAETAEESSEPAETDASSAESTDSESSDPETVASGESEAAAAEAEASESEENAGAEETEEAREKRLARQRDREVKTILRQLLDEIVASYVSDARGVEIREIAGGYRMATKPECHDAVRGFVKSLKPALKLSLPALETLAVIAYKQPVTAPEVNEIRGVDASGVFGSLLARKLIATAGRKQVIGRPILYKTTKEFLLRFGLKDVSELPSMEEFEKMAAMELEDAEIASTDQAAPASSTPELDENVSEEDSLPESAAAPADRIAEESETPTTPEAPPNEPPAAE